MATVPVTVNAAEPLVPELKLKPVSEANVSVPCATDSVRESEPLPAAGSLKEIALLFAVEKASDPFSLSEADVGAVITGPASAVTVIDVLAGPVKLSPGSVSEALKVSAPT